MDLNRRVIIILQYEILIEFRYNIRVNIILYINNIIMFGMPLVIIIST